jgi:hypothetical protein
MHFSLHRLLLVESGPRHLLEGILPFLRSTVGAAVTIDLVTCYSGLPAGLDPQTTRVWRVQDYQTRVSRASLLRDLRARAHTVLVIICAGVPIMTKWKWMLALRLSGKILVVNENADCFWLERSNWRAVRRFISYRSGFPGAGAIRTLPRLALFPFTFTYLLLYAGFIHARRSLATVTRFPATPAHRKDAS